MSIERGNRPVVWLAVLFVLVAFYYLITACVLITTEDRQPPRPESLAEQGRTRHE